MGRAWRAKLPLFFRTHPNKAAMKADIHPEYKQVVFQDISSDFSFLTRSTMGSKETVKWEDGQEYPLIKVEISSHSHPFFTGKQKIMDTAGRVDKFRRRYAK
jgi:large subunit ribosomal protein L31